MSSLVAILALGFALGMRHATDADHVVAVSTIVSRQRSLRAALPVGVLWGLGHTITILLVGGAIVLFGVVIPPRVGLGMELCVGVMLVALGVLNVRSVIRDVREEQPHEHAALTRSPRSLKPLAIGVVHGLAGSAAVALLVLGAIRDAWWGLGYLLVFGVGTIGGMAVITIAMAVPVAASARRFERFHRALALVTGVGSLAFGALIVYEIGVVHGLFTSHPQWTPR